MTDSLAKKYDEFVEKILSGKSCGDLKEDFLPIIAEEIDTFNREFGGGNSLRLQVITALCEVMAQGMRQSLGRLDPRQVSNIDKLKAAMGVISFEEPR